MRVAFLSVIVATAALPAGQRRVAVAAGLVMIAPMLAVVALLAVATWTGWRRIHERRAAARAIAAEVALLGDLVGLGLSGGRPFPAALAIAGHHLASPLGDEVAGVVRQVTRNGAPGALAVADGAAVRLYQLAGRALSTGAPLGAAVLEFTDEVRAAQHTERLAAARRLPVILMVPLALLILPGFVLLTVAPAVVGAIERIGL